MRIRNVVVAADQRRIDEAEAGLVGVVAAVAQVERLLVGEVPGEDAEEAVVLTPES